MARNNKFNKNNEAKKDFKEKSRNRSRGNRGRSDSGKKDITQENNPADKALNDWEWYFSSKELVDQAAQLSFQNVLGLGDVAEYEIPSVLRVDMALCPGVTVAASDSQSTDWIVGPYYDTEHSVDLKKGKAGVNLMASKLYTTMSTFTGRTASYGPQDVAMNILAIAAVAEWSEAIRRAFGIALTYNYRNRVLPLGLLRTMNLDVNDFISRLSEYRMRFNVAMSRINQIPLLENIKFIVKARDIYQYVYQDDPTSMSQLFYYMPKCVYTLEEADDPNGSVIRATEVSIGNTPVTMNTWLGYLETMINKLLESSTQNFIYADLLNMSNKLKLDTWQFDYLAENYVVTPIYNENALLQLHNATIVGVPQTWDDKKAHTVQLTSPWTTNIEVTHGYDIFSSADRNEIVFNPMFNVNDDCYYARNINIIDMPTDSPTIEQRVEALRIQPAWSGCVIPYSKVTSWCDGDYGMCTCFALPDHFITGMKVYRNVNYNWTAAEMSTHVRDINTNIVNTYSSASSWPATTLSQISVFEHAPLMFTIHENPESSVHTTGVTSIHGQLQYYTTVDYTYIQRLLDLMYVGLFDFRV